MKINITEKCINPAQTAVSERLSSVGLSICCKLQESPAMDIFQGSAVQKKPNVLKRFIDFFSPKKTPTASIMPKNTENEQKILGLKLINDPKFKKLATEVVDAAEKFNPKVYSKISNIEHKLQNVDDLKIKAYVDKQMEDSVNLAKLDSVEELLDAYHISQNHYSSVGGELNNYYKTLGKSRPEEQKLLKRFLFYDHLDNFPMDNKAGLKPNMLVDFDKESKLEGLKKYIEKNKISAPEMTDYMYEKYYLNALPPSIKKVHQKILNEFGTKLFYVENPEAPELVYKELFQWKKAGGAKFKPPNMIDLSEIKEAFLAKRTGQSFDDVKRIDLKGDGPGIIRYALRHELMHQHDTQFKKVSGVINGVDFDEIQAVGKYSDELFDAGLNMGGALDYAYTNKQEFVAVAAQGEFSKYSKEFKKVLIKLGTPEWVFKMEQTNPQVTKNVARAAERRAEGLKYRNV